MFESTTARLIRSLLRTLAVFIFCVSVVDSLAHAATQTWAGGTNSNWSGTSSNWSGSQPAASDVAQFNTTYTNQPTINGTTTVGAIYATTGLGQNVVLGGGSILTLTGTQTINGLVNTALLLDDTANHGLTLNAAINLLNSASFVVNNSGTLNLNGNVNLAAGRTLTLGGSNSSGVITFSGPILSTTGAVTINTSGTVNLTGSNTYTGATTLTAGTLNLSSFSGTIAGSSITLASGTTFAIDSGSGTYTGSVARVNNVTMGGNGRFIVNGTSAGDTVDVTGTITINSGAANVITVNPNSGHSATLSSTALAHGTGGLAFVNGSGLGSGRSGIAGAGVIAFATTPAFVGSQLDDTGAPTPSVGIIPYLIGEVDPVTGIGTNTGTPNTFVTYNGTTGLRPLTLTGSFTEYISNDLTTANASGLNARITTNTSAAATVSVNSLLVSGGNVSIGSGATLKNASGAVLITSSNTISGGTLSFQNTEGLIVLNSGGLNAAVSSAVTVSGSIAKPVTFYAGAGSTLTVTGGLNDGSGGNSGSTLTFEGGGTVVVGGSSVWLGETGGVNYNVNVTGNTVLAFTGTKDFGNFYPILSLGTGSVFDSIGTGQVFNGFQGTGVVKLTGSGLNVGSTGTAYSNSNTITGGNGMTIANSSGTTTFSGLNNYAGGTTITSSGLNNANSALKIGGGNALSDTGIVKLTDTGSVYSVSLDLASSSETIGSLSSSASGNGDASHIVVTNTGASSSTLAINTSIAGDAVYSGVLKATTASFLNVNKKGSIPKPSVVLAPTQEQPPSVGVPWRSISVAMPAVPPLHHPIIWRRVVPWFWAAVPSPRLVGASGAAASGLTWTGVTTSNVLTLTGTSTTSGLVVGQVLTGTNLAGGTYITSIDPVNKILLLSSNATGTGASDLGASSTSFTTSQTLGNLTLTAWDGQRHCA